METILHSAILCILRPLIRILHHRGVAFGEFSQLARQVYVEAAECALLDAGEKATTSRIAITTGLTRKDVAQLRKQQAADTELSVQYNRCVRVISGWLGDADFQDTHGNPATLAQQGTPESFEALVSRYSGDMPYRAMLKELQHNQLIAVSDHQISLLNSAYIPQDDEREILAILGQDVGLLIKTIEQNLQPIKGESPYFQRKVSYDNLPRDAVEQFKTMVQQDGMELLVKFNDWLSEHDRDTNPHVQGTGTIQAGVGIYYFEEMADGSAVST